MQKLYEVEIKDDMYYVKNSICTGVGKTQSEALEDFKRKFNNYYAGLGIILDNDLNITIQG